MSSFTKTVEVKCFFEYEGDEVEVRLLVSYSRSEDRHGFTWGPAEIYEEAEIVDILEIDPPYKMSDEDILIYAAKDNDIYDLAREQLKRDGEI